MSKYFQDVSPILNTVSIQEKEPIAAPQPIATDNTNLRKSLEIPSTIEEEILQVAAQSAIVNETMKKINETTPNEIDDALKKFKPAELFERLNQITFLMIEMNNRMTAIEAALVESNTLEDYNTPSQKLTPREQYEIEGNKSKDLMNPDIVRDELRKINSGKTIPTIPNENYVDKGVSLEEMYPDKPDEAYQAAYQGMADAEKQINVNDNSKSPKGGMSSIKF